MAYFLALIPTPLNILHASGLVLKVFMPPIKELSRERMSIDETFLASLDAKASMVSLTVHSQIMAFLSNDLYI